MHLTSRPRACFGVSLLLAAVTGVLSAPILAQEKPADDSAQGETLSPEASPATKKGVYLSQWFNQDLTLIGSQAQAGRDIDLKAGNDLDIRAVQNASRSESES